MTGDFKVSRDVRAHADANEGEAIRSTCQRPSIVEVEGAYPIRECFGDCHQRIAASEADLADVGRFGVEPIRAERWNDGRGRTTDDGLLLIV